MLAPELPNSSGQNYLLKSLCLTYPYVCSDYSTTSLHRDALKIVCKDLRGCCNQGGDGVFSNVPLITWHLTARATRNSSGKWKDCICCRMHLSYINDAQECTTNMSIQQVPVHSTRLILWDKWDGNFCWWQNAWGVFIFSRMTSSNVLKLLFH